MFVQNFNKWFSLVPNKMFVLVECCENSAADSTSPFIWLLHPIMKIPPAPIPFLLPGLDNICKLWKARASNNDFDTISQCTGSEKVCKTKCLGVEGVSIGRGKFCTEIYMGRFAGSVWFFVLQGGWRFNTSFPVRPNLMYCSNRDMGLDLLSFWLWGKLKNVKKKCGQFHKSPSNYSWHRTRTNPAWMISSSRTNWAKIISENHNVSELWKCFQGCPFQKRETFKLMSKSLNAFTISIWHSFQLKSLLTQI